MVEVAGNEGPIMIVQDPEFRRIIADAGITFFLGRDVELATLAVSPGVISPPTSDAMSSVEGAIMPYAGFGASSQFVETGRIRMSPSAAMAISMNLLQALLDNGQIEEAALRSQIEAMITMSATSEDSL